MKKAAHPYVFTTLLAVGLGLGTAMPLADAQSEQRPQAGPRPLRAMTYNIHHGTGNDDCTTPPGQAECGFNLERIADVIRQQDPDIVALQEVDRFWRRSGTLDHPALLAKALGMKPCYGANLSHDPDSHSDVPHQYGTLILSSFPILECRNTFLPSTRPPTSTTPEVRREQRGLLEVLVNVRGVPLRVYNTHLEHTAEFTDVRAAQINAALELIGAFEEDTILMGDLNAQPDAPELQPMFAVFKDSWLIANPGAPGFTYSASPSSEPDGRIDYVLFSNDVVVQEAEVVINDTTRIAADHYPVRVDLELPGSHVGIGR